MSSSSITPRNDSTSATHTPPENSTVGPSKHDNLMTHMKLTVEKILKHTLKTHGGENLMTHIENTQWRKVKCALELTHVLVRS